MSNLIVTALIHALPPYSHSNLNNATCIFLQALARNETLTALNIEKKARWREELKKPSDSAVALSDKAQ